MKSVFAPSAPFRGYFLSAEPGFIPTVRVFRQDNSLRDQSRITHRSSHQSGLRSSFPGFAVLSPLGVAHCPRKPGRSYTQAQDRFDRWIVWHWTSWNLPSLTTPASRRVTRDAISPNKTSQGLTLFLILKARGESFVTVKA